MAERILFSDLVRNSRLALSNRLRLLRRKEAEYVVLRVSGSYPERTPRRERRFPLSLLPWPVAAAQRRVLHRGPGAHRRRPPRPGRRAAHLRAGRRTGHRRQPAPGGAPLPRRGQTGRRLPARPGHCGPTTWPSPATRSWPPRAPAFTPPASGPRVLFLKDTLALVGIEADFEAIAEYKVSPDTYRRAEMTEPHREMLESLLDSIYDEVVERHRRRPQHDGQAGAQNCSTACR